LYLYEILYVKKGREVYVMVDNVINFSMAKVVRGIKNNRYLRVKYVQADPRTGEWLTTPEFTKQMVSEVYWKNQEDTSDMSHQVIKLEDGIEYAVLISWV
jgi:hypothetical protein